MEIKAGRYTANYPDEFVLFLIGLRINSLRDVRHWAPVLRSAFAMNRELAKTPDSPLLHTRTVATVGDWRLMHFIQYWRSLDELERWASDADFLHRPNQKAFFKRTGYNGKVGIWHETYVISPDKYEAIYGNMPAIGLAAAGEYRTLRESSRLRDRVGDPNAS